jgi:hypothetical protein
VQVPLLQIPEQALPHVPQLAAVLRSEQTPPQQPWPAVQACPQVPQLAAVLRFVQTPPQQPWPAAQACPHVPQLFRSVWVLTQVPLHATVPLGQLLTHVPFRQCCWELQVTPQAPQLLLVFKSVHTPPQQGWPAAQAFPQAPQLEASVWVLAQVPLHGVWPDGHWQTPPTQVAPVAQALPQVPQLAVLELVSRQLPLQNVRPGGHWQVQVVELKVSPPGHAVETQAPPQIT